MSWLISRVALGVAILATAALDGRAAAASCGGGGGGGDCALQHGNGDSEPEELGMLQVLRRSSAPASTGARSAQPFGEIRETRWAMLKLLTNYAPEVWGWNENFSFPAYEAAMKAVLCSNAYLRHNLVGDWGPRDVAIEYGAIADYSINGHYTVLGATILNDTIRWKGDVVRYDVQYQSVYDILGLPIRFTTITHLVVTFATAGDKDPGCIVEFNATDTEPMKSFSQVGAPETTTSTCNQIYANCGAEYFPFKSQKSCKKYYSTLPWQCASGFGKGNSWVCRNLHVYTSEVAPSIHCNHTIAPSGPPGPEGGWTHGYSGGFCRDQDCEGSRYCYDMLCIVRGQCVEDPETYLMTCEWEWFSWWRNLPDALSTISNILNQILSGGASIMAWQ